MDETKKKKLVLDAYTFTDAISTVPLVSAANKSDERATAASNAIMHDENRAETLLIRENMLCIGNEPRRCVYAKFINNEF